MYCSECGQLAQSSLSYCSRCGAELRSKELNSFSTVQSSRDSLICGTVGVTVCGLGAVIALMAIMKEVLHLGNRPILALTLLVFATFLSIDLVFIWLLLRSVKRDNRKESVQLRETIRKEIEAARLSAPGEPVASVTEHTTRTLAPVPRGTSLRVPDTDRLEEANSGAL